MVGIFFSFIPMEKSEVFDILVIGGGLAGLTTALHLSQNKFKVGLIEKNTYPNHKVCGEYVSNEVLPYLNSLNIFPFKEGAKKISSFQMSDINGRTIKAELPLGGFGISRFAFDNLLYNSVKENAEVIFDSATELSFAEDKFIVKTQKGDFFLSHYVVGAFGKRSNMDIFLKREFIQQKTPWLAVKSHFEYEFPNDRVALHNFKGGYCGLSKTESNVVNACYLTTLNSFKKHGNIETFQEKEISLNPHMKKFYDEAVPLFEKPLTISQISFDSKNPVENHVFMVGDSAGLIHPLCGNGMAMAIRSAQLLSELFLEAKKENAIDRRTLEIEYAKKWNREFKSRLRIGSMVQKTLMNPLSSKIGFSFARVFPSIVPQLIKRTHG